MRALEDIHPGRGITAVRAMMGIILIKAGLDKLPNLGGFAGFLGQIGFPAPDVMAPFIGILELVGGILVLVGFGAHWLGLIFLVEFLVTTFIVKLPRMGWDPTRIDLMMLAGALMLLLAGAGKASVDEMLARRRAEPVRA
jgi:putative oxidoreductase